MSNMSDEDLDGHMSKIAMLISEELENNESVTVSEKISGFKALGWYWSARKKMEPKDIGSTNAFDSYNNNITEASDEDGDDE
jgi:hypothetical protein